MQDVQLSEEQFRLLYGNAPVGVAIVRDERYLYVNSAFAILFGYNMVEELQGMFVLTRVAAESQEQVARRMERVKRGEQITGTYEISCLRKGGSSFLARVDVYHVPLAEGPALAAYITDITVQKEAEQLKDDFLSMVSHELRTPLTTVKAFTQILLRKAEKEERADSSLYLSKMDQQIDRITNLITALLDLSRVQADRIQFAQEPFDIDAVVVETVNLLQSLTLKHHILIEGKASCIIVGDAERIEQALFHLLSNAIKYSPYSDNVIVRVRVVQEQVLISVQDFGMGIPRHHQSKIFERFYRVYEDKNVTYPGLGIGLYLTREIIERHSGTIWVESAEGQGTTFSFTLPFHTDNKQDEMQQHT